MNALYSLLPAVYQRRDADQGYPLRALLAVVQEQYQVVADELDQLYDDWFVETCQDWVLPYIGALVGHRSLPGYEEALGADTGEARLLEAALAPRADVAGTVRFRRRKGTLAVLEDLAAAVAAWPARAVEFRTLLAVTPPVRLLGTDPAELSCRTRAGGYADLRGGDALDRLDGPFDELAHTVDVRRLTSTRTVGRFGVPEVGVFVWRLRPYSITYAPAHCRDRDRAHFTFSILGNDTPLLTKPVAEPDATHIADETNVPAFIRRYAFDRDAARYYGPGKSLSVWLTDPSGEPAPEPVPLDRIVPADLSGWTYPVTGDRVAVDVALGRIAFPARRAPDGGVWVSYHYGFSADIGGGEYPRPPREPDFRVGTGAYPSLTAAIKAWRADGRAEATIELMGSAVLTEQIDIQLDLGHRLTLRAAPGSRPVLRLLDWYGNRPDAMRIVGTGNGKGALPTVVLDGLMVTGRSVRVQGQVGHVRILDCTLVPGWSLEEDCACAHPEEPSLELVDTQACVEIERSIVGTILVDRDEVGTEPAALFLSDSIVDACGEDSFALVAPDGRHAHVVLSARRTTVFGRTACRGIGLVENSIFTGDALTARRQSGCVRFTYLAPGSAVGPHFHCEPELSGEPARVVPRFTDVRYGTPGYAQLALSCADEIRRGADDGAELGVFHDLFTPQRADLLAQRLDEYTPAGTDAAAIIAT